MIRRKDEYRTELRQDYRGGGGAVTVEHLMEGSELLGRGRLLARCTLEPGSGIGYHTHKGETEWLYFLSGVAKITAEDGSVELLYPGDITMTQDGEGHSIHNAGEETLVYLAEALYCGR